MQKTNLWKLLCPWKMLALAASSLLIGAACQTPGASESGDQPATPERKEAPETRASAELPQSDLVLWLFAEPGQLEVSGESVVQWRDASGRGNDLVAPGQSMQPVFSEQQGRPVVRFDGQDDMLMTEGKFAPDQLAAATVFIVAAPSTSAGQFDGLISAGNRGAEDSFTGFNIDLGGKNFKDCADTYPDATSAVNTINAQSAKTTLDCGRDLLDTSVPFERPTLLTVRIDNDETSLRLDGQAQQSGGGGPNTLSVPQLRLGARFHRQKFQGHFDGAISEVIVYGRSLSDDEIATVESQLAAWYGIAAGD